MIRVFIKRKEREIQIHRHTQREDGLMKMEEEDTGVNAEQAKESQRFTATTRQEEEYGRIFPTRALERVWPLTSDFQPPEL